MTAALEAVDNPELAAWLTVSVPHAIVAGAPLPERPPTRRRRRTLFRH
jgi:hypothetical protein